MSGKAFICQRLLLKLRVKRCIDLPLGYESVYMPLDKVADTSCHIQGDEILYHMVDITSQRKRNAILLGLVLKLFRSKERYPSVTCVLCILSSKIYDNSQKNYYKLERECIANAFQFVINYYKLEHNCITYAFQIVMISYKVGGYYKL